MSYEDFMAMILGYMGEAGVNSRVVFNRDTDKKIYTAEIPDEEIQISCRESGLGLSVKFHQRVLPVPVDRYRQYLSCPFPA